MKEHETYTDLHHRDAFVHPGQDRIHLIIPVCVRIKLEYKKKWIKCLSISP